MMILVTGAEGMLGSALIHSLQAANIPFKATSKHELDITEADKVKHFFSDVTPSHVINCAAYTAVDAAESEKEKCRSINTGGVQNLVAAIKDSNCRLVQISTDYVFSGRKEYLESDDRKPINYYGATKVWAEEVIERELENYLIVRTSWLFGANGKNFVDTIYKLAETKDTVSVVNDQIGCPTYTNDLADWVVSHLDASSGVYHVTNSGSCSWHEFATKIISQSSLSCTVTACSSDEYPQAATRPYSSVLKNTKTKALRSWQKALYEYLLNIRT